MRLADLLREDSAADFTDALRLFSHGPGIRALPAAEVANINDLFDANLERLYVPDGRVWRGMALADWNDLDPAFDFRHREIVADPHWMSTSTDRGTAENYMRDPPVKKQPHDPQVFILLEIAVSGETRGIHVAAHAEASFQEFEAQAPDDLDWSDTDAVSDYYEGMSGATINEEDAEIILQRGSRFRVMAKERKPCAWKPGAEYWEVKLEWIGAG